MCSEVQEQNYNVIFLCFSPLHIWLESACVCMRITYLSFILLDVNELKCYFNNSQEQKGFRPGFSKLWFVHEGTAEIKMN